MSEDQFRIKIAKAWPTYEIELVFPVLWHAWECDPYAAILKVPGSGRRVLVISENGTVYIEDNPDKFLKDRRKEYSKVAAATMAATRLLNTATQ